MIRLATFKDLEQICQLAQEFWQHSPYDEEFDRESTFSMLIMCYENDCLLVGELDNRVVGFCAMVLSPLLVNKSVIVATELAWWVSKAYRQTNVGAKLFLEFERRAKEKGATRLCVTAMESSMPDQIKAMYEKKQYTLAESTYQRKV